MTIGDVVLCTGCHFRCELNQYQCQRGESLYNKWVQTGEIPTRPMRLVDKNENNPNQRREPPTSDLVAARLLELAGCHLREQLSCSPCLELAHALAMHEGKATVTIAVARARLPKDLQQHAIDELVSSGLAEYQASTSPHGEFLALTQAGVDAAASYDRDRRERTKEYMSVLGEDDIETLVRILSQMVKPPHGAPPKSV